MPLFTPPAQEPISLTEAKLHCHIDGNEEDSLLQMLIVMAREYVENETNRALITQTHALYLKSFPVACLLMDPYSASEIELPMSPLQSVTSVKYTPQSGADVTMVAGTDYQVDTKSERGLIAMMPQKNWPQVRAGIFNPIEIIYVCGYADTGTGLPQTLCQAILMILATLYKHKEQIVSGMDVRELPLPFQLSYMLAKYASRRLS